MRSWYPPFAQTAKDGAAIVLLMPARSKAWATRPKSKAGPPALQEPVRSEFRLAADIHRICISNVRY